MKKRKFEINTDDYWMGMALMLAGSSTATVQQACVILNQCNEPIGMASNGSQNARLADHPIHAETKAIFACPKIELNSTAYVTHTPCYHCVTTLLSAKIYRIVYLKTDPINQESLDAVRCASSQIQEFAGNLNWLRDYLKSQEIFSSGINKV